MTARIGIDISILVAMFGDPESWCGISASSVGPTIECPTRLALPRAHTTGDAAERGNALHEFARVVAKNPAGRAHALEAVPKEWRHTAEGMDITETLKGLRVVGCERAYALDVKKRSVRYIGENIYRDYNGVLEKQGQPKLSRYEVPFTMDVQAFDGDTPVELDYKSGQYQGEPSEHWQRRICATGLIILNDSPTATSRVAYIWDDGRIFVDEHTFSMLDIDEFCDIVVKAIDAVWKAREQFAQGIMPAVYPSDDTCRFCAAMTSCPYYTNFAKSMMQRLKAIEEGPELSELTEEEKGQVWRDLKVAEKIVEETLKAMKKMADIQPIIVGDKEIGPSPRSRTYFKASEARGLIVMLLGREGKTDEEIKAKLAELQGETEYFEYRAKKRKLSVVR